MSQQSTHRGLDYSDIPLVPLDAVDLRTFALFCHVILTRGGSAMRIHVRPFLEGIVSNAVRYGALENCNGRARLWVISSLRKCFVN